MERIKWSGSRFRLYIMRYVSLNGHDLCIMVIVLDVSRFLCLFCLA